MKTKNFTGLEATSLWSIDGRGIPQTIGKIQNMARFMSKSGDPKPIPRDERGRPTHDVFGDEIKYSEVRADGTGIIYAKGVMVRDWPSIASRYGFVDMMRIREDVEMMEADDSVERVAFIHDSPGGMAQGNAENFDAIRRMRKPTMAFSEGLSASASYYQAAAADYVSGTRSSEWGSVGTFAVIVTFDGWLEDEGIEVEVIRSGKFKGMGIRKLDEEERALMQHNIDTFGGQFRGDVKKNRKGIKAEDLQGQWFMAAEAASKGFIHAVSRDFDSALASFRKVS
jgi:ClpP class serine protease